jgi:hypothetical protein
MHTVNIKNLDTLIDFLENLEPSKFDFSTVVNECGTVCCAIGWTPKVFPDLVEYYKEDYGYGRSEIRIRSKTPEPWDTKYGYKEIAVYLFEIDKSRSKRLFTPNQQDGVHWSLPNIHGYSPPIRVANMLKIFANLVYLGHIYDHKLPESVVMLPYPDAEGVDYADID